MIIPISNKYKTQTYFDNLFVFMKSRFFLVFILVVFTICKIPHLLYPFYWDESWPYAPALHEMYKHGISLLPSAIGPDFSRGHPLFFHAAGAFWMHLFGSSNISLHAYGLFISLLLLITVYEAGYRLYNKRVAAISLLLVAGNVSIFVQSSFILPEVLIALLAFLSIYLYITEKYLWATVTLTLLFLTKETGLIAGLILGMDGFISLFQKSTPLKKRLIKFLPPAIATAMLGLYFLLQKHTNGWYLFPLHTDMVLHVWSDIYYRFRIGPYNAVFGQRYPYVLFIAVFILAILAVIKERKISRLLLLTIIFPMALSYYFVDDTRYFGHFVNIVHLGSSRIFVIFIAIFMFVLFAYSNARLYENKQQSKFVLLSGTFAIMFIIFSSFLFFTGRYVIMSIVPILFILAVLLDMLLTKTHQALYYPLLAVIIITTYLSFKSSTSLGDTEIGFFDGLRTQAAVVEFMERSNFYDNTINCSFLNYKHLTDAETGFLSTEKEFKHVNENNSVPNSIMIFDNIETDGNHDAIAKDSTYTLVYQIKYGTAWTVIYKKKTP